MTSLREKEKTAEKKLLNPERGSQFPPILEDLDGGGEYGSTHAGLPDTPKSERWPTPPSPGAAAEPFPFGAVVILAICMSLNMYTLSNLFPYVGMMVKGLLGMETTNEVGFLSGYVASSFTFGRFLSGYVWGAISDRFGRKPVIIIGLLSIATFSMIFGCSTSYKMALISRLTLGLTNGIMPALRTTVSEVCGPEHVVVGMTYLTSTRAFSIIIGTGLGGVLSQPALHYPDLFSGDGVFGRYPYLLPNFVATVGAVASLLLVIVYLPETKDFEKQRRNSRSLLLGDEGFSPAESPADSPQKKSTIGGGGGGTSSSRVTASPDTTITDAERASYQQLLEGADIYGQGQGEGGEDGVAVEALPRYQQLGPEFAAAEKDEVRSRSSSGGSATDDLSATSEERGEREEEAGLFGPNGLLAMPHVNTVLALGVLICSLEIGFDEVYPLFALSTPAVGGLGWNTMQIGQVMVVTGLLMAACQLVVFPSFIKMVGLASWQRLGCGVGIVAFIAVPAVKMFSWDYPSLFAASVVVNTIAICCFDAVKLALTIGSTNLVSSSMRGKLSGLYNTAESLGRFIGPAGYSITYAWSVSPAARDTYGGWVDYRFIFYMTAAVLLLVGVMGWRTLTVENMMKPGRDGGMSASGRAAPGGNGGGGEESPPPGKVVTLPFSSSPPPLSAFGHKQAGRDRRVVDGGAQGRIGLATSVDLVV